MIQKEELYNCFSKEDMPLVISLYEKYMLAYQKDIPVFSKDFYPPNIWSFFQNRLSSKFIECFGIFDIAERRMVSFNNLYGQQFNLCCLKVENKSKFRNLMHRDYLGAVLSLGIKRSKLGDLIVDGNECYIAVEQEIKDYILNNLKFIANCPCIVSVVDDMALLPKVHFKEEVILVSKLRIDSIVAKISHKSREKAIELIDKGMVLVDYSKVTSKSKEVKVTQRITIRGIGKFILGDIVGNSKNGKFKVIIKKYT